MLEFPPLNPLQESSMAASVTLALIPKNAGNPYFDNIAQGFSWGCKTLECELTTVAPEKAEAASQIPLVAAQIEHRVDIIAIAPNSPTALAPVLDEARRQNILVLAVNSDMPGSQNSRDAAILPVDFSIVAPSLLELLGATLQYEGDFAILSTTPEAPDQNAWIADIKRLLAQQRQYARMKLVTVVYGNDDARKSLAEAKMLLERYPKLKGIMAPTSVGLTAAAQAVSADAKVGRVKVTGLGMPNQMRRFVDNGTVTAFQLWSPYNVGLLAAHFAVGVRRGNIRNKPGKTFTVPGLEKKFKVLERSMIYAHDCLRTFDRQNIAQFNF